MYTFGKYRTGTYKMVFVVVFSAFGFIFADHRLIHISYIGKQKQTASLDYSAEIYKHNIYSQIHSIMKGKNC